MPKPVFPIVPPYTPELLLVVQYAVENILGGSGIVFEYGSGYSTLWFAQLADVVSVEHDEEWSNEVIRALIETGPDWPDKVAYMLVGKENMPGIIHKYHYDAFDLVLVDCVANQRNRAVKAAMPHVKLGGWLLLDDSHWPTLKESRELLKEWPCTIVRGPHIRHTGVTRYHQTSMYQRPAEDAQ